MQSRGALVLWAARSLPPSKCSERRGGWKTHKAWVLSFQNLQSPSALGRQSQSHTDTEDTHRVVIPSQFYSSGDALRADGEAASQRSLLSQELAS